MQQLHVENKMAVPRFTKVTINVGIGKMLSAQKADSEKIISTISEDLSRITGQKPQTTYARKDIATFKLRQGAPSGLRVTLRGRRMYDFLTRLIQIGLPRTRDFKGIKLSSVDEGGNLTMGIREHIVFPEVSPDSIRMIFGFSITIGTTAKDRESAIALFRSIGIPFERTE